MDATVSGYAERIPQGVSCPGRGESTAWSNRVRVSGKHFRLGQQTWCLKGVTYGPFASGQNKTHLPARPRLVRDFAHLRELGANAIRVYHIPDIQVLDDALEHGLRVLIDVPWDKHRCFFEDLATQREALRAVCHAAKTLGGHPAALAISIANEIPHDVVRFYGSRKVEAFIDTLVTAVRNEAPDCLATYANYPSTEFLSPAALDFYCANIYLEDTAVLSRYLDRLQHVAGSKPLILGELGVDSLQHGLTAQSRLLAEQVRQVYRHGLAGAFAFSYTDDWFTGGSQVERWAFGITDRQRHEKPAAGALREVWQSAPCIDRAALPGVSVIVCSYNGAATLEGCLTSLSKLDYPDYEVILVDDGSTDRTRAIAGLFPNVRYVHQENLGLSAARNAGLALATRPIVAYTDSDCEPDDAWLLYLVGAMQDQGVQAIGGPNVPPPSDSWVAKCVAASPGGPSHVMLDDQRAEHVPGCNMAFDREMLLNLGGFDVRFRQAGDDVDICWRLIDAGHPIGYAPAALVWHHRRSNVRAYLAQQRGYGRSEAMLTFKHPQRFNLLGNSRWLGVIYGEGAVGLPVVTPRVYHGQFGAGPFQIIYRQNGCSAWVYFTLMEWQAMALLLGMLGMVSAPLGVLGGLMFATTLAAAIRSAAVAPLPAGAPFWCRPLVFAFHLLQPVARALSRYRGRLSRKRLPETANDIPDARPPALSKVISWTEFDLYWISHEGRGREHLLEALVELAKQQGWAGDFTAEWHPYDIELHSGLFHNTRIRTATEELGGGKRFTRVRCTLRLTRFARTLMVTGVVIASVALLCNLPWEAGGLGLVAAGVAAFSGAMRPKCRRAISSLLHSAAGAANLESLASTTPEKPIETKPKSTPPPPPPFARPMTVTDDDDIEDVVGAM